MGRVTRHPNGVVRSHPNGQPKRIHWETVTPHRLDGDAGVATMPDGAGFVAVTGHVVDISIAAGAVTTTTAEGARTHHQRFATADCRCKKHGWLKKLAKNNTPSGI